MKVRLVGILVTAAILAAGFVFWRSTVPPDNGTSPAAGGGAQQRGGQIVTSGRAGPRTFNRLVGQEQFSQVLSMLTQGRLGRVNYATFEVEPGLPAKGGGSATGVAQQLHTPP